MSDDIFGIAIDARTETMVTMIINSIKVNPRGPGRTRLFIAPASPLVGAMLTIDTDVSSTRVQNVRVIKPAAFHSAHRAISKIVIKNNRGLRRVRGVPTGEIDRGKPLCRERPTPIKDSLAGGMPDIRGSTHDRIRTIVFDIAPIGSI